MDEAYAHFGRLCAEEDVGRARYWAGALLMQCSDACAYANGRYFARGLKAQREDLERMEVPAGFLAACAGAVRAKTPQALRAFCRDALRGTDAFVRGRAAAAPAAARGEALAGMVRESVSTFQKLNVWRADGERTPGLSFGRVPAGRAGRDGAGGRRAAARPARRVLRAGPGRLCRARAGAARAPVRGGGGGGRFLAPLCVDGRIPRGYILVENGTRGMRNMMPKEYKDLCAAHVRGFQTWNTRSVLSHVDMETGYALNVCLKDGANGQYLKEALIGRFGEQEEKVTPEAHAWDGGYTSVKVEFQGVRFRVESCRCEDAPLILLVTPLSRELRAPLLVLESGFLWNPAGRPGPGEEHAARRRGEEALCRLQHRAPQPAGRELPHADAVPRGGL